MTSELFFGAAWLLIRVAQDGQIIPLGRTKVLDTLKVKAVFHIGPNIYSVVNLTKGYQCFVEFKRDEAGRKLARCNHDNCQWQGRVAVPYPCKHMRAACKWHVKLMGHLRRRPINHPPTDRPVEIEFLRAIG